jgi:S-adenosylmethionine:tRNA ribosyltransferase-isomerase
LPVNPKNIQIKDYTYELPAERIAQVPLKNRDESKLLIYDKGSISSDVFRNISRHIPEGSLLIFNDTKVVNARLIFQTLKGKAIEIFCLEPASPQNTFVQTSPVKWNCMVEI